MTQNKSSIRIAILGAGFAGLGMAARLKMHGYEGFTIFEKSVGVGGTWRDNTYPGAGCDVPSHLYSFSYALNPNWDYKWSLQPQILSYMQEFAEERGILPHCQFNTQIAACYWKDAEKVWEIITANGETHEYDALVSGLGQLNIPSIPNFEGKESFQGASFHSARWDHGVDLTGKTVAVIGNGPSAVQFLPEVASKAAKLINFQRSPAWTIPRGQRQYTERDKQKFAQSPWRMKWYRWRIWRQADFSFGGFFKRAKFGLNKAMLRNATKHLEAQITDPVLRKTLTPDFAPGCKRILISDDYYPALARENVDVIRQGVNRITPTGIEASDGTHHAVDVIIYSTGFQSTSFLTPLQITGQNGLDLNEVWVEGAKAYKGVTVAGFPNFFMLYGPNTNLGHNSIIFMIEQQAAYIARALDIVTQEASPIMVRETAMEVFNESLQNDLDKTVWAGDCESWYKNEAGKITNNWSGYTSTYRKLLASENFKDYERI